MQFTKEFLRELCYEEDYVHTEDAGSSRWLRYTSAVFEHDGKLYQTEFATGKSEVQEYRPYEDDPDIIECPEVQAVTELVKVTTYQKVINDKA